MNAIYPAGLACLGLAIGVLAGGSNTPVIGTLLPLLFGLIGGATGFFVFGLDLSAESSAERLRLLGLSLVALSVPALIGSLYGSILRTGQPVSNLFPRLTAGVYQVEVPTIYKNDPLEYTRLALLRNNMQLAAIPHSEQKIILENARKANNDQIGVLIAKMATDLAFTCTEALALLTIKSQPAEAATPDQTTEGSIHNELDNTSEIENSLEIDDVDVVKAKQLQFNEFVYHCDVAKDLLEQSKAGLSQDELVKRAAHRSAIIKDYVENGIFSNDWMWISSDPALSAKLAKLRITTNNLHEASTDIVDQADKVNSYVKAYLDSFGETAQSLRQLQQMFGEEGGNRGFAIEAPIEEGRT